MTTRKEKNIETVDVVRWDGLKETALAFFGMEVLNELGENPFTFDDHLWIYGQMVPIGWYIVKEPTGILDMCPEEFNRQYEIIDEYPA